MPCHQWEASVILQREVRLSKSVLFIDLDCRPTHMNVVLLISSSRWKRNLILGLFSMFSLSTGCCISVEIKYDCEIKIGLSDVFMIWRKPHLTHGGQFHHSLISDGAPKNAALWTSSLQDVLRWHLKLSWTLNVSKQRLFSPCWMN